MRAQNPITAAAAVAALGGTSPDPAAEWLLAANRRVAAARDGRNAAAVARCDNTGQPQLWFLRPDLINQRPQYTSAHSVLLGNVAVGKTWITRAFQYAGTAEVVAGNARLDQFNEPAPNNGPTIGGDFRRRVLVTVDHRDIGLILWDTSGQERFHSLQSNYVRHVSVVLMVYDITDRKSFTDVFAVWLPFVERVRGSEPVDLPRFILVGAKLDQVDKDPSARKVLREDARRAALEHRWSHIEVSALEFRNIELLFAMVGTYIIEPLEHTWVLDVDDQVPVHSEFLCVQRPAAAALAAAAPAAGVQSATVQRIPNRLIYRLADYNSTPAFVGQSSTLFDENTRALFLGAAADGGDSSASSYCAC